MAFNIFKKKEDEKEPLKEAVVSAPKVARKPRVKAVPKAEKPAVKKEKKKFPGLGYDILKSAAITEKAAALAEQNQYIFKVFPKANKIEIKKAVEGLYGVDVAAVRIINVQGKKTRVGRIEGVKSDYKKAIVKVRQGQKIEILPR